MVRRNCSDWSLRQFGSKRPILPFRKLLYGGGHLFRPETTPTETVFWNSPESLPIATAVCPTLMFLESPKGMKLKLFPSTLRTAISWEEFLEVTIAGYILPSLVIMTYAEVVFSTICLFVKIIPSLETKIRTGHNRLFFSSDAFPTL